jgi:hypothetical protein
MHTVRLATITYILSDSGPLARRYDFGQYPAAAEWAWDDREGAIILDTGVGGR